jgi:NAD(P)-dependent dehydrogenase (short-subunit alcohol dehydrogenase family)
MADFPSATPAWLSVQNFVTTHGDTYPAIDSAHGPSLAGKSVLITGASKGIGRMTAIRYARAGCDKIALAARSPLDGVVTGVKTAAADAGHATVPQVLAFRMDITSETDLASAAETIKTAFGGHLYILIANAATVERWVPLLETDPADWWNVWEVNVKGTYLTIKHFLPLVLASPTKIMILLSSIGAHVMPPGASGYELGKRAVIDLAQYAMTEYGDRGLVAVALGPGCTPTENSLLMPKEYHWILTDTVELPADFMVWLGRERREWLAGRYVDAKWDVEELEKRREEIVARDLLKLRAAV